MFSLESDEMTALWPKDNWTFTFYNVRNGCIGHNVYCFISDKIGCKGPYGYNDCNDHNGCIPLSTATTAKSISFSILVVMAIVAVMNRLTVIVIKAVMA